MTRVSPLIQEALGEARKAAAGAISSTSPMRLSGVRTSISLRKSPSIPEAWSPSVTTVPGLMALTRILRGPSSLASDFVIASTAAFVAP